MPFARSLAAHGDRDGAHHRRRRGCRYRELAERVAATADRLGPERRLVLLAGANTVDALVVHLAALAAGHPVLLVPGDQPKPIAVADRRVRPGRRGPPGRRRMGARRATRRIARTPCTRTSRCC